MSIPEQAALNLAERLRQWARDLAERVCDWLNQEEAKGW